MAGSDAVRAYRLVTCAVLAVAGTAPAARPDADQENAVPAPVVSSAREALDPWIGEWDVFVGDGKVGVDRVEKVLNGAAILEHWTDARGGEGKSFFYFMASSGRWKQVWVQADGVVKEKASAPVPGGVRFEGRAMLRDGRDVPDRTTLTWLAPGRVRQHIEVSRDGGATWTTTFDATYVRRN
jgi:hypothetical protein